MLIERAETIKRVPENLGNERLLSEWLDNHGIKAVLFDLDDTLLQTFALINPYREAYLDAIHPYLSHLSREELVNMINGAESEVYKTHAVSPGRWMAIAELIADQNREIHRGVFTDPAGVFAEIYSQVPAMFPGSHGVLEQFAQTGKKLGLVTHANKPWTELKLYTTGIGNYFDHVEIVDEFDHKNSTHWAAAISALGIEPHEALVIGDSLSGDIQAAKQAGVRYRVLLPNYIPYFKTGDIPNDIMRADSIKAVIPELLRTP